MRDPDDHLLTDVGRALYGDQWQSPLARDLQVNDRTMRRWIARDTSPPAALDAELIRLVDLRVAELQSLAARLRLPHP